MTTAHREVERKFRVPGGFGLPDLASIHGVARAEARPAFTMRNDYYDTEDLRLFRWGITLRRREGGPDAGWHLKLPVSGYGEGVRDEIRAPLSTEIPTELLRIVTPFVRTGSVQRVAGLHTHRTPTLLVDEDGLARIEVVDDHVDIIGGESFREIEAEALVATDGGLDDELLERVSATLLAAGASPGTTSKAGAALGPRAAVPPDVSVAPWPDHDAPAADVVHAYLAHHTRRLLLADLALRRDLPDAVHQMRVSARRLRSGLKVFAPLIDTDWAATLREELGWMAAGLGLARDTEVMQERLDTHAAILDDGDADVARAVIDLALATQVLKAEASATAVVDSPRYAQLLDDLVAGVRRPPFTARADQPADEVLPLLVAKTFRRLVRRIAALAIDGPSPAWHEARIAAKRARYAADAVAPVLGRDMARLAERLADVTEILGTHQDAHVAQQALRSMADEAPPAAAFALGRLVGVEEAAEMADREAFFTLWPTVAKAARRARVA